MFRLRPTPIALSNDEVCSCAQRILLARILEGGGYPLVSPLERRLSSSRAGSMDHPFPAPESSSFEGFIDCGPDDCDRSPTFGNGKRRREASSEESQVEHPPGFPALRDSPPSSTDAQLAEQLDTITLNFTSFLSPSTWLGSAASSSGSVRGNMYREWGNNTPTDLCQMKPLAFPIPTGLSLFQCHELYSDTSPCSAESNKDLSVPEYSITDPTSPGSARCCSPCCQSTPSTPQFSDSRDTDSGSEDQDDFVLPKPSYTHKFERGFYRTDCCPDHFYQCPTTSNELWYSDNNRIANRSPNVNIQRQRCCPNDVHSTCYSSASSSHSCYGLDSIFLKRT